MSSCVLILTNGVIASGRPSLSTTLRLDRALHIWKPGQSLLLSTGYTKHHPVVLDRWGLPIAEAEAGARYLTEAGVPRVAIMCETLSHDTIGNIFYSYLLFIAPLDFRDVTIVTSAFHAPRTEMIAAWLFDLKGLTNRPNFAIVTAADPPMSPAAACLLKAKEDEGRVRVSQLRQRLRTIADVTIWLQRDHAAYAFDGVTTPLHRDLQGLY